MVRPVWPIWKRCGRQPASTAAREAPDRGADDLGELLEDHEVLRALEAAAARHDDLGLGQLRQTRGGLLPALDQLHRLRRASSPSAARPAATRPPAAPPDGTRWAGAWRATASCSRSPSRAACPRRPAASPTSLPSSIASAVESADETRAEPRGQARHQLALPRGHRREDRAAATPWPPARRATGVQTSPRYGAQRRRSRGARRAWRPALRAASRPPAVALSVSQTASACPPACRRETRRLAEDLRHDLLRIALTIIFDDAPERARHALSLPLGC